MITIDETGLESLTLEIFDYQAGKVPFYGDLIQKSLASLKDITFKSSKIGVKLLQSLIPDGDIEECAL